MKIVPQEVLQTVDRLKRELVKAVKMLKSRKDGGRFISDKECNEFKQVCYNCGAAGVVLRHTVEKWLDDAIEGVDDEEAE